MQKVVIELSDEDYELLKSKPYRMNSDNCLDSGEVYTRCNILNTAFDQGVMLPEPRKHIDHTDCIWNRQDDESNICPSTCSQYRDGWNDAIDYIFNGGEGYRPYRRGSADD